MRKKYKDISSGSSSSNSKQKKYSKKLKRESNEIYSSSKQDDRNENKIKKRNKNQSPKTPRGPKKMLAFIGKIIVSVILIGIISMSIFLTGMTVYVMKAAKTESDISLEKEKIMDSGITVVHGVDKDNNVQELAKMTKGSKRLWVDINDVPNNVKNAFIALEDQDFYKHDGVNFSRTFLAFLNLFLHFWNTEQGASTITQQLVKTITADKETGGMSGITRKIREISRAVSLEKSYSKDQILQAYLNCIPVGGKNGDYVGIQTAAKLYYNKDISQVTLAEAASLASITNAPVRYEPIGQPENNKKRRDKALKMMLNEKYISQAEYDEAVATPVKTNKGNVVGNTGGKNYQSYAIDAVINEVAADFAKKEGISKVEEAADKIKSGGYNIYTTIDPDMQDKLEKLYMNPKTFGWSTFSKNPESSFIIYDLEGNMKACVGGTGEKPPGDRSTTNYATAIVGSPGSTMKPLVAYAPAIEKKLETYNSIVQDTPIKEVDGKPWPQNFDRTYKGSVPLYYSLERSLNTIPTKLVEQMGVQTSCDFLKNKLGFTTIVDPANPMQDSEGKKSFESSGIAMGSMTKGVRMSELTNAFQIFGNNGSFTESKTYTNVKDISGSNVLEKKVNSTQAVSKNTSQVMNRMLRNVITKGTGTGANMDSKGIEVVGKTGTSNDDKNLTFVGLTPNYVAGLWVGIPAGNTEITKLSTSIKPPNIWKTVMTSLLSDVKNSKFQIDQSVLSSTNNSSSSTGNSNTENESSNSTNRNNTNNSRTNANNAADSEEDEE